MSVRIKICGVRTMEDAELCVAAGADLVGFNFWPNSKRFVTPAEASPIVRALAATVVPVGVFVAAPPAEVARAVAESGVKAVQLHGDEDPSLYQDVGADLIQVIRIKPAGSTSLLSIHPAAQYVLLDAWVEGFGGAGQSFDWSQVRESVPRSDRRVLLGGGLNPENVADAIRAAQPWGVDVASGVESAPGQKDPTKVRKFVAAVRAAGGAT